MDGVTILNETTVEKCLFLPILGLIIFSLILIALICLMIYLIIGGEVLEGILVFATGLVFLIAGISYIISVMNRPPYQKYEVIISDKVSFKDFTNKYEIIEQHGEIYVVKER